jgi:WD40 repeat protein
MKSKKNNRSGLDLINDDRETVRTQVSAWLQPRLNYIHHEHKISYGRMIKISGLNKSDFQRIRSIGPPDHTPVLAKQVSLVEAVVLQLMDVFKLDGSDDIFRLLIEKDNLFGDMELPQIVIDSVLKRIRGKSSGLFGKEDKVDDIHHKSDRIVKEAGRGNKRWFDYEADVYLPISASCERGSSSVYEAYDAADDIYHQVKDALRDGGLFSGLVEGDWGAGKTWLLRHVEHRLNTEANLEINLVVQYVDLSTWRQVIIDALVRNKSVYEIVKDGIDSIKLMVNSDFNSKKILFLFDNVDELISGLSIDPKNCDLLIRSLIFFDDDKSDFCLIASSELRSICREVILSSPYQGRFGVWTLQTLTVDHAVELMMRRGFSGSTLPFERFFNNVDNSDMVFYNFSRKPLELVMLAMMARKNYDDEKKEINLFRIYDTYLNNFLVWSGDSRVYMDWMGTDQLNSVLTIIFDKVAYYMLTHHIDHVNIAPGTTCWDYIVGSSPGDFICGFDFDEKNDKIAIKNGDGFMDELFNFMMDRALLTERGRKNYVFLHGSFRDFLIARIVFNVIEKYSPSRLPEYEHSLFGALRRYRLSQGVVLFVAEMIETSNKSFVTWHKIIDGIITVSGKHDEEKYLNIDNFFVTDRHVGYLGGNLLSILLAPVHGQMNKFWSKIDKVFGRNVLEDAHLRGARFFGWPYDKMEHLSWRRCYLVESSAPAELFIRNNISPSMRDSNEVEFRSLALIEDALLLASNEGAMVFARPLRSRRRELSVDTYRVEDEAILRSVSSAQRCQGHFFVAVGSRGSIHLLRLEDNFQGVDLKETLTSGHQGDTHRVALSLAYNRADTLLVAGGLRRVKERYCPVGIFRISVDHRGYPIATEEMSCQHEHTAAVNSVAISRCGQWLASGGDDGVVFVSFYDEILDGFFLKYRLSFDGVAPGLNEICFSPSVSRIAAATGRGQIAVWSLMDGFENKPVLINTSNDDDPLFSIEWKEIKDVNGSVLVSSGVSGNTTLVQMIEERDILHQLIVPPSINFDLEFKVGSSQNNRCVRLNETTRTIWTVTLRGHIRCKEISVSASGEIVRETASPDWSLIDLSALDLKKRVVGPVI